MNESGFTARPMGAEEPGHRQPVGTAGGRYRFYRTRRYGKLHFEKCVADAWLHDLLTLEALRKEFEIGYQLDHPGIVKYLAMEGHSVFEEYVDGLSLRQMEERFDVRLLDGEFLVDLARQLLEALRYIHSHGIVHLDIKPENVMVCNIGNRVKLVDFGSARNGVFDTTEGHTPAYMTPEQAAGAPTGVATDIYLVGRLMEELAARCGQREVWSAFVGMATATDPRGRFRTASEALAALPSGDIDTSPGETLPSPAAQSAAVASRPSSAKGWRGKLLLALGALLGVGVVVYGVKEGTALPDRGESDFEQARILIQGHGGAHDEAEGLRLMQRAAEKGDAAAQCYMGIRCRDGDPLIPRDPEKSAMWTRKAAEQGHEVALEEMAFKYYEGFGVEKDYGEAMIWFRRAAEKGQVTAYASMGIMYRDGEGAEPSMEKAEECFLKGAGLGNVYCAYLLGRLYGHYMKPNHPEQALEWYVKASDMGSHRASEYLMNAYTAGDPEIGLRPDSVLATKYTIRYQSAEAR